MKDRYFYVSLVNKSVYTTKQVRDSQPNCISFLQYGDLYMDQQHEYNGFTT